MKITSVELHPANSSDTVVLSFRDPSRANPYLVKAIIGLDADAIIPRYYGVSGNSLKKFYNLSLESRQLAIRMGLNPSFSDNETYSDLRDAIYKIIASSRTGVLDIQFKNGSTVVASISGFVSKLEAPQFNKEQEIQLTLDCKEPMLKAPTATSIATAGLDPASTILTDSVSTAPHGFKFEMNLVVVASMKITDPTDASWSFEVVPDGGFLVGDVLHFSSELNNKYIYIVRGATTIYLADKISLGSFWPIMFPGANHFAFDNPTMFEWTSISYYNTYWGI